MSRNRSIVTEYGLDALVVVLAVAGAVGTAVRLGTAPGDHGSRPWLEAAAVAAVVLSLLLRRWAPFVAPAATWLVGAALSFADGRLIVGQSPVFIAGMIAAVLLGSLADVRQARVGLAVVVVGATTIVYNDPTHSASSMLFIPALFVLGWLVGFVLHERSEQTEAAERRAAEAERDRAASARVAVAEERARIARELHDVVAHSVSVMVLQVGAVRHRMPAVDAANRAALENVEHAGRVALSEMRRIVDAMRSDGEDVDRAPAPGLAQVPALVEDVRRAGLDARLEIHGDPVPLAPGLDLSAYRIVQEGLTNTLRHAHASHANVRISYDPNEIELEVLDDGLGDSTADGTGHGLVGIRERVKIYGGQMTATAIDGGGFALSARLPLDGR
ncbi:sensor histidine kinase [Intrasporangium mesophilum]